MARLCRRRYRRIEHVDDDPRAHPHSVKRGSGRDDQVRLRRCGLDRDDIARRGRCCRERNRIGERDRQPVAIADHAVGRVWWRIEHHAAEVRMVAAADRDRFQQGRKRDRSGGWEGQGQQERAQDRPAQQPT
jgi:hypothetical protein